MKCKALVVGVLLWAMVISTTAFAWDTNVVETKTEVSGGEILFNTMGGVHKLDCRCVLSRKITIKESKQGLLTQGKVIYLKTDEGIIPERIEVKCNNGNVRARAEKDKENNIVKIILENIDKTAPVELQVIFDGFYFTEDMYFGMGKRLGISLLIGDDYENNLFGGLPTEEMVLNHAFIDTLGDHMVVTKVKTVAIKADENHIYVAESPSDITTPAYMNEKNQLMIPVRAMADAFGLGEITWDAERGCAVLTVNNNTYFLQSGKTTIDTAANDRNVTTTIVPLTLKEGTLYMYPNDLGKLFGINEEDILWGETGHTVKFVLPNEGNA